MGRLWGRGDTGVFGMRKGGKEDNWEGRREKERGIISKSMEIKGNNK